MLELERRKKEQQTLGRLSFSRGKQNKEGGERTSISHGERQEVFLDKESYATWKAPPSRGGWKTLESPRREVAKYTVRCQFSTSRAVITRTRNYLGSGGG